jgi:hypothetical protein
MEFLQSLTLAALFAYLVFKTMMGVIIAGSAYMMNEVATAADSMIKDRVDAYRAEQIRAKRDWLADLAEKHAGADLRAEDRMVTERIGRRVSTFQARLITEETESRRRHKAALLGVAAGILGKA